MSPRPRPFGPAFIVHDLKQALTVLRAAAELDRQVVLVSPPAAAAIEGALWFRELIGLAAAEVPAARLEAVIDCGDHPGYVLESLSLGLERIRFQGDAETTARLDDLARTHGARLIGEELEAMDLDAAEDPNEAVRHRLQGP
jgi:hypothetical protein